MTSGDTSPEAPIDPDIELKDNTELSIEESEVSTAPEVDPSAAEEPHLLRRTLPPLAVAGAVGAFEVFRRSFQRSQVFYPSRYPEGVWDPSLYGLPYEDVWFEAEDGTKLHGWWIEHPKPSATIVFCHGNTGSISDLIGSYLQLRRLKVNVLAFDYRGYGKSEGQPSERGLFMDVRAACDYVSEEQGVALDRTLLFGHSLGGAVAIDGACHRPVAGLVVQSSFTQVRDMARHLYSLPLYLIARNEFRSIDKVPSLGMPKLFIHGREDATVPFDHGKSLYQEAAEPKLWCPIEGAGHNDVDRFGGSHYFRTLARFRRRCLEPLSPAP